MTMTILATITASPWICGSLALCLGLCIGSFLNVVIFRLPLQLKNLYRQECQQFLGINQQPVEQLTLAWPHSFCPHCKVQLAWYDNIPLVSFILLHGHCRHCNSRISFRYPAIEFVTAILTTALTMKFGVNSTSFALLLLTWALIPLIFIDLDHEIIPDEITLPILWLGLICNAKGLIVPPSTAIIGTALGYGSLYTIALLFKILRKCDGIGRGDFKLFALFGAWFGWEPLINIILGASITGAIVGISLILIKKANFTRPLPFAPYLVIAGWSVTVGSQFLC